MSKESKTIYPYNGTVLRWKSGQAFYVKQWSGSFASGVFVYNGTATDLVDNNGKDVWVAVRELQSCTVADEREKHAVVALLKLKGII